MRIVSVKKGFKRGARTEVWKKAALGIALPVLVYLLISLYFTNHFFLRTVINGVNVSLKAHDDVDTVMESHLKNYVLSIVERDGETEEIMGPDIGLKYKEENNITEIFSLQKSLKWFVSVFSPQAYYVRTLFVYNNKELENKIKDLHCLNRSIIEPRNVSFRYGGGSYEVEQEVYGNKIIEDRLEKAVRISILKGETKLDLNEAQCYENPRYTLGSFKTLKTLEQLNTHVSANITYKFGDAEEKLEKSIINNWLSVDENLDVVLNKAEAVKYVKALGKKYDTVGAARKFKTSIGKVIEVKGGLYGWKINQIAEANALLHEISQGAVIEKEPVYSQKAASRGENEIGNTYVEINLTRQHLWFYKNGKLITHGPVVTGNPGRGNATVVGTYMLNYKQKGATLSGQNYSVGVSYWMPFYGNIGVHDAKWRYSFGGQIYKRNGTHGCVNAPFYLAKTIFENLDDGTPFVCYEE